MLKKITQQLTAKEIEKLLNQQTVVILNTVDDKVANLDKRFNSVDQRFNFVDKEILTLEKRLEKMALD